MKTILAIALVVVGAAFALPVGAQSDPVLTGDQITESALIDALAPPTMMTRGLKPGGPGMAPKRPAGASLLIEFKTNSTELTPQAREQLDVVGKALNTERLATLSFQVIGHADPRGNSEANQKLSEGRAQSVRAYLVSSRNVEAARLTALGMGDREPLNKENPAAPENRRVQIVRAAP